MPIRIQRVPILRTKLYESSQRRVVTRNDHYKSEENNVLDPDDGNSWSCSVCNLPIFSTPFISSAVSTFDGGGSKVICQHDQCAYLPNELNGSDLHPNKPLLRGEQNSKNPGTIPRCDQCGKRCGAMFYYCPDSDCSVILDVLCALTAIKILHRSHEHRLMAIRGVSLPSFICGACGTRHDDDDDQAPDLFYICHPCGFWIHPECASLPNAVILKHQHPLVLRYDRPTSSLRDPYSSRHHHELKDPRRTCAICEQIIKSLGFYSCNKCSYHVHIMCAVSDHQNFKPVLISEAGLPDLVRLPIPDEHTSVIQYITDSTTTSTIAGGTSSSNSSDDDDEKLRESPLSFDDHANNDEHLPLDQLHEHPLILHYPDDNDHHLPHLCHACVQLIFSRPFYKCSECPDFFLHNCCARLPRTLTQPWDHEERRLSLIPKPTSKSIDSTFYCQSCSRSCHGFAYFVETSRTNFHLDVLCALMPASITHSAHARTHILYMTSHVTSIDRWDNYELQNCDCCGIELHGVFYECGTCRNFRIHVRCALLPDTVRHKFDQHPLKLTTTRSSYNKRSESSSTADDETEQLMFCEICESHIDNKKWYYSCDQCDHSFHADCFPCLDRFSMIKFGATIRLKCHDCPLTRVRGRTIRGSRCGYCQRTFDNPYSLAWECSDCYFRIHDDCARHVLELH